MKKILTLLFTMLPALSCLAQMPQWVIRPDNDTIYVKLDDTLLQTETGGASAIWSMDGKQLYTTDGTILPFREGAALVLKKGSPVISGFIDTSGQFTALPDVGIAYGKPYFENDFLLCYHNGSLTFFNKKGSQLALPNVEKVYPFSRGLAPYFAYLQPDKKKSPYYSYFRADSRPIQYSTNDFGNLKRVELKDIDFVSGIGTTGKGVAVIKNKLYWFDPATDTFDPLIWGEDENLKKRQLTLVGNYEMYFQNLPADTFSIRARYGKDRIAMLKFDNQLRPLVFSFEGDEMKFVEEPATEFTYKSELSDFNYGGRNGLSMGKQKVLPAQFEAVGIKYGDKAMVKKDGKWGVVTIKPDLHYSLKLNRGEDVPFRHQKFNTIMRLDLPAEVSAKDARIDIPESTGCLIDKTSREYKDTESGNFVTYECTLLIPELLPDTSTLIAYKPVSISCDGIELFDDAIEINAWHLKSYNVDPIEAENSISNGVATFTLNIAPDRAAGDGDYPFEVRAVGDSLDVQFEKMSETRYKFVVSNLQEGINDLNIYVTEKGCPSSEFPFEIVYIKPASKKAKEELIIRKKDPML